MNSILKSIILGVGILGIVNTLSYSTITNSLSKDLIDNEKLTYNMDLEGKTCEEAKLIIQNEDLNFLIEQ